MAFDGLNPVIDLSGGNFHSLTPNCQQIIVGKVWLSKNLILSLHPLFEGWKNLTQKIKECNGYIKLQNS